MSRLMMCNAAPMLRDGLPIDENDVRRLLKQRCPDIAERALSLYPSRGTDNLIFKLGRDMCVRLPLSSETSEKLAKEIKVLSDLPRLSLQVPTPLYFGQPTDEYKRNWAVYHWLDGQSVDGLLEFDAQANVELLGECIRQLRASEISSAPVSGPQSNYRGCRLGVRDELTVEAMANASDLCRLDEMKQLWSLSLELPDWQGDPVFIHGDIHAGNLLARNGRLNALIDFGLASVGDPAVDLIVGWSLLDATARRHFRDVSDVDEDTWRRGRGWAFSIALISLAYYRHTNPYQSTMSRRVIEEVLADYRSEG